MIEDNGGRSHRSRINDLSSLRIYAAAVEAGSLTKAGQRMNIGSSTVSKHIAALETGLKAQLIIRSTQGIAVTELGRQFYERCGAILQEVEDAEEEASSYQTEVRGVLRVSCQPALTSSCVVPMLDRYLRAHPKVAVELEVTTLPPDLVASGLDAAIGISSNLSPDMIVVKLAENERLYCATPAYLRRHGRPASVRELTGHNCLVIRNTSNSEDWPLRRPGGAIETVRVRGNFVCNDAEAALAAALRHLGVAYVARISADEHLRSGELVELFPDDRTVVNDICIVVPKRRYLPLKTRTLIDHLRAEFKRLRTAEPPDPPPAGGGVP